MKKPGFEFLTQEGREKRGSLRARFNLKAELILALVPALTVLGVLVFVEVLSRQHILFTALASSAFLIYLDPQHVMNKARTLITAQVIAAGIGYSTYFLWGPSYGGAAGAMLITTFLLILIDRMHPPAIATSLSFAFRTHTENGLILFALALGLLAILLLLQRYSLWFIKNHQKKQQE